MSFVLLRQVEIDRSEKLMQRGDDILDDQRYVDVDSIEPKSQELRIVNRSLAEKLLERINVLTKARMFQMRIKKVLEDSIRNYFGKYSKVEEIRGKIVDLGLKFISKLFGK